MARNLELEAAILADPDDEAGYLVYADWLQSQGDPRGELAMAQAAGDSVLAAGLVEAHHEELFGGLNARVDRGRRRQIEVGWRLGWFERVRIVDRAFGLSAPYSRLVALASARFIRWLEIEVGGDGRLQKVIADHGLPWPLSRLDVTLMTVNLGDLGVLWPLLPGLRELSVAAMSFELGSIELPKVTRAKLACQAMTGDNLLAIAEAHWPRLQRLEIGFLPGARWGNLGRTADPALLRRGFVREDLPSLRELAITYCATADELVPELVGSPVLAGLRHLDLSGGHLSDDGAEVFLRHARAFAHLESLNLKWNLIGAATAARLAGIYPQLRIVPQRSDEPFHDEAD